jgi:voltage-gated potassium channel
MPGKIVNSFRRLLAVRKFRIWVTALAVLFLVISISTLGIRYFEDLSYFESFWLSLVTMTTVGYGDLYPKSVFGRIFVSLVTMLGGIGAMAYMVSLIATVVIERELRTATGDTDLNVQGHILIINCPNEEKVHAIIDELRVDNKSFSVPIVLISDDFTSCPEQLMKRRNFFFVRGNPILKRVLDRANAPEASQAVLLARDPKDAHSDGATTQVALSLEAMHRQTHNKIYVVAEAVSRDSVEPMKTAGVDDVVCLENIVPPVIVQAILDPGIPGVIHDLTSKLTASQLYVAGLSFMAGKPYAALRERLLTNPGLGILPIGILREGKPMMNPDGRTPIFEKDRLVYIADNRKDLEEVCKELLG